MNRKMVSDYFGGRRRVYWGQEGGFYPPYSLSDYGPRISNGPLSPSAGLVLAIPVIFLGVLLIKGLTKR